MKSKARPQDFQAVEKLLTVWLGAVLFSRPSVEQTKESVSRISSQPAVLILLREQLTGVDSDQLLSSVCLGLQSSVTITYDAVRDELTIQRLSTTHASAIAS
ncbi:MAG: hypothetical protein EOP04_25635 [Proteobacteria bacterium]|nr:MAG: hypothetical protein EOP04_25635 [Pseudomonadota bacterium]